MALSAISVGYTYSIGHTYSERALSGVSLSVEQGDLVLVLGATGSGKSTLLRLMTGLLEPGEGELSLDGMPLSSSTARGAVGLVFQDPESQLFADTVIDDVMFGPRNLGLAADTARVSAEEALLAVGIEPREFAERSPFALSGGESRRVAIAGVLAMNPRYLLLDEPTAGLDSTGRSAVRSVVRELRTRAGVVIVSHSAEEFLGEATSVLVLAGGAAAYMGTPDRLLEEPSLLAAAGLDAPAVLKAQLLARARGVTLTGPFALDPVEAAVKLAQAGGWV
jgi:energy-coupling factor transport system ATP-binding protein